MDALDNPPLFQLVLRHSADAVRCKVRVSGLQKNVIIFSAKQITFSVWLKNYLDATKAAEVFVTLLLPLGNQVWVSYLLLRADVQCLNIQTFDLHIMIKYF